MTRTTFKWNPSYQIVIHCTWTQDGHDMEHDFTYTGDLLDAISYCYQEVLGSSYPDFKIELKEYRRV